MLYAMARRTTPSAFSRRLLIASVVFGLFVLFDIALFGWLIFRSLSEREIKRVLLETRTEAEKLAQQLARPAEGQGKDLYTAMAVERETQTYIDQVMRQRGDGARGQDPRQERHPGLPEPERDACSTATGCGRAADRLAGAAAQLEVHGGGRGRPTAPGRVRGAEHRGADRRASAPCRSASARPSSPVAIEVLRRDLVRQASVVGVVTVVLLLSAYAAVWLAAAPGLAAGGPGRRGRAPGLRRHPGLRPGARDPQPAQLAQPQHADAGGGDPTSTARRRAADGCCRSPARRSAAWSAW